jgi:predicted DNA binding CopG/RHH family protein
LEEEDMKKKSNHTLDKKEQKLLDSFEKGKWKQAKNFKKEMEMAKQAASNFLKKDSRINIRLSSSDLLRLKRIAANV